MSTRVAGVLLAAGDGSRLGQPKALVEVGGQTLAERGVALLRDGGADPVLLVTGAVRVVVDGARSVRNLDWRTGMGASLAAGLHALETIEQEAPPRVRPIEGRGRPSAWDDPIGGFKGASPWDAPIGAYRGLPAWDDAMGTSRALSGGDGAIKDSGRLSAGDSAIEDSGGSSSGDGTVGGARGLPVGDGTTRGSRGSFPAEGTTGGSRGSFPGGSTAMGPPAGGRVVAAVIALADQPLVGPESVRRLIDAFAAGAPVAVAAYDGKPRNPVLIGREHWAAATAMAAGDVGARPFLRAHPELVTLVECGDTGSPFDIDTPADLAHVAALSNRRRPD